MCKCRLSHSETAVCFLPSFAPSLAENALTAYGQDMSDVIDLTDHGKDMSGVIALAAALKDSHISTLK